MDGFDVVSTDNVPFSISPLVASRFDFFNPSVMRMDRVIRVPFTSQQMRLFFDFDNRGDDVMSRRLFPLSELGVLMDYFMPNDEFWWSEAIVDEGVIDRREALFNLGLYVRSAERSPPYVRLGDKGREQIHSI